MIVKNSNQSQALKIVCLHMCYCTLLFHYLRELENASQINDHKFVIRFFENRAQGTKMVNVFFLLTLLHLNSAIRVKAGSS